jgi:hypothetical protein
MYGQKSGYSLLWSKTYGTSHFSPTALLATGAVLLNSELMADIQTNRGFWHKF